LVEKNRLLLRESLLISGERWEYLEVREMLEV